MQILDTKLYFFTSKISLYIWDFNILSREQILPIYHMYVYSESLPLAVPIFILLVYDASTLNLEIAIENVKWKVQREPQS